MTVWREGDKRRVYIFMTQNGYKLSNKKAPCLSAADLPTKNIFSFSFSNGWKA